jgi:hypothetical protein
LLAKRLYQPIKMVLTHRVRQPMEMAQSQCIRQQAGS